MIQKQYLYYVVDIDIKSFFDNVNHTKLIRQMWNLGIRDKTLLSIIKEMLKAPILMPNGKIEYPTKVTPQGGILSPLLSNIVLNELDWWVASQWEEMPTHNKYSISYNYNGTVNKSYIRKVLRKTDLKEMYIVRYADDFKIFCKTRSDADKIFIAVRQWIKERLKLEINEEKSKVANLKKNYSEFLGFKIKAVKKKNKYVVYSNMTEKAIKNETVKLKSQIKLIQHSENLEKTIFNIKQYNLIVLGIHNYYRYATNVNIDCRKIQYKLNTTIYNRLGRLISKKGIISRLHIQQRYGLSKQLIFICNEPICPIGYIQTRNHMHKKVKICKYTKEGREEIHKNLKFSKSVITVLHMLSKEKIYDKSIEYYDNRISLYSAQYGKCAVTGKELWIDEIHCHHKLPKYLGGSDNYFNLVIIHKDIHKLIHVTSEDTIKAYLNLIKPTKTMLDKINKLRITVGNAVI